MESDTSPDTKRELRLSSGAEKKVAVTGGTERALVMDAAVVESVSAVHGRRDSKEESSLGSDVGVFFGDEVGVDRKAEKLAERLASLLLATANDEPPDRTGSAGGEQEEQKWERETRKRTNLGDSGRTNNPARRMANQTN